MRAAVSDVNVYFRIQPRMKPPPSETTAWRSGRREFCAARVLDWGAYASGVLVVASRDDELFSFAGTRGHPFDYRSRHGGQARASCALPESGGKSAVSFQNIKINILALQSICFRPKTLARDRTIHVRELYSQFTHAYSLGSMIFS